MCALVCDASKFKMICIFSVFDKLPKLLIQDDIFEVNIFRAFIKYGHTKQKMYNSSTFLRPHVTQFTCHIPIFIIF